MRAHTHTHTRARARVSRVASQFEVPSYVQRRAQSPNHLLYSSGARYSRICLVIGTCSPELGGCFLAKLRRKTGEEGQNSTGENSKRSSGENAPKLQISVACRGPFQHVLISVRMLFQKSPQTTHPLTSQEALIFYLL